MLHLYAILLHQTCFEALLAVAVFAPSAFEATPASHQSRNTRLPRTHQNPSSVPKSSYLARSPSG